MKQVFEVIILGVKSYSESSIWVCFFSRDEGIQNGIIKGGKKKRTKALVLGLYDFTLYKSSSTSGLLNIVDLERSQNLDLIYKTPPKVLIAFFMADSLKSILVNCGAEASFFDLAKKQILNLSTEKKLDSFPVYFLGQLISFLGYAPLRNDGPLTCFDPLNGAFNPKSPSSSSIRNADLVDEIHLVFNNTKERELVYQKEVFEALIQYACQHVPGYSMNKSIGIIRDVLYS